MFEREKTNGKKVRVPTGLIVGNTELSGQVFGTIAADRVREIGRWIKRRLARVKPISEKQWSAISLLSQFEREYGRMPSVRELSHLVGLKSSESAHRLIQDLIVHRILHRDRWNRLQFTGKEERFSGEPKTAYLSKEFEKRAGIKSAFGHQLFHRGSILREPFRTALGVESLIRLQEDLIQDETN